MSPFRLVAVVAGVLLVAAPGVGAAEPAGSAGSWIHVDPATGRRVPAPPGGVALPPDPAYSSSHAGLVERPAPGGGTMVDLQGRFRSAVTATAGADGTPRLDCVAPGAGADPQ